MCILGYTPALWLSCIVVLRLTGTTHASRPVINGLPVEKYIGDLENAVRLIQYLNVTSNELYTCDINAITGAPTAAIGTEFQLKHDSNQARYELWTTSAGVDSYNATATNTYTLDIVCENKYGELSNGINDVITIHVVAGEKITFATMPTNVTRSAPATGAGITIHTESVSTTLGHPVECRLESVTISGYFAVDEGSCSVYTTANLVGIDASTPTVTLVMSAYDTTDKIEVYETLLIKLEDQNHIPATFNMESTVTDNVDETANIGDVLFEVSVSDRDRGQIHEYSMNCVPKLGNSWFNISARGQIMVKDNLDYETKSFFKCSVFIYDQYHTGGPFMYHITVNDINEAPVFNEPVYYATFEEGQALSQYVDPNIICTDEDASNTQTLSFLDTQYSSYFSVDSDGIVTLAKEYDADLTNAPTNISLTLQCTDGNTIDGNSKTGNATLVVTILLVNDNDPVFVPASQTIYVDQFDTPGSVIGKYAPTDADKGTDGNYTCSATSFSAHESYYNIGSDCNITVSKTIDLPNGTPVKYDVTGTDQGSPTRTGEGKLDIIYRIISTTTVSTTTTTAESYNFFREPGSVAMFVLLLLAGLALLGLLAYCLARLCCGVSMANMCKCVMGNRNRTKRLRKRRAVKQRPPQRRVQSYTPQPQKVRVVEERPVPIKTVFKQVPSYYKTTMPTGQVPHSPFVPYL